MSGADGNLLAEYTDDFSQSNERAGAAGEKRRHGCGSVKFKLEAARKLVPYIRLVERERLRVPVKSKQAYTEFFESNEINALFDEILSDKLAISQILLLLRGKTPFNE